MKDPVIKVLAFGTFDGLHEGHLWFLRKAREHGERLVVVVARDEVVERLKNRMPQKSEDERVEELKKENLADEVVVGDEKEGSWEVVKRFRPEVIALGYDQDALKVALEHDKERFEWDPEIKIMESLK